MPPAGGHYPVSAQVRVQSWASPQDKHWGEAQGCADKAFGMSLRKEDVSGQGSLGSDLGKKTRCGAGVPGWEGQCTWDPWWGREALAPPAVWRLRRTWTLQVWTQVDTIRVWLSEEILPVDEGTGVFCIMCVIFFVCESLEGMCTVCVCGAMWLR